jgi:hypothetical protein
MQWPDHSTIAAFVSSMQEEILSLFCEILLVCEEQALLGGTVFALDGVKLSSNASKQWSGTIEELKQKQEKLETKIEQLLAEHQQVDTEEREEQARPTNARQAPEARNDENYPGESHEAVPQVTDLKGDGTDSGHLSAVLDGAKQNMQGLGHDEEYFAGKKLLADTSYHRDGDVKSCEDAQLDAYLPDPQFGKRHSPVGNPAGEKPRTQRLFTREDVQYDERTERYRCPNGKFLHLKHRALKRKRGVFRLYASKEKDCRSCELREHCLGGKRKTRRSLSIPVEQHSQPLTRSQQMIAKIDTEEGRRQYSRRLGIVEPVFATIRTQKRLDHVTLRGKQQIDIQWML